MIEASFVTFQISYSCGRLQIVNLGQAIEPSSANFVQTNKFHTKLNMY